MNYNLLIIPVYLVLNNMIILEMINDGEVRLIGFNSGLTAKRGKEAIQTVKLLHKQEPLNIQICKYKKHFLRRNCNIH